MEEPGVPPGYSPPLATVTDNDRTAWVFITTILGLIYSLLFGLIRVCASWTTGRGRLQADDVALMVSMAFATVQCSVLFAACSAGFGQTWPMVPEHSRDKVQQLFYASFMLFIMSLGLSKMSVVLFQARLTASVSQRRIFRGFASFVGTWTIGSCLALAFQCNISRPWLLVGQHCYGTGLRWTIISFLDILTEVVITSLAFYLVWNLQMSRTRKWAVVSAFAYRLINIIPVAFRLATYDAAGLTVDPTFKEVLFVVWTQVELHFSIISATIPVLRPVANNLNTSYSSLGPVVSSEGYAGSSSGYKLSTLKSVSKMTGRSNAPHSSERATWETQNAGAGSSAFVNHGTEAGNTGRRATAETDSIESHSSEQMIIRKQISWRVERGTSESPTEQN